MGKVGMLLFMLEIFIKIFVIWIGEMFSRLIKYFEIFLWFKIIFVVMFLEIELRIKLFWGWMCNIMLYGWFVILLIYVFIGSFLVILK